MNSHFNMLGCPQCCNPLVDHLAIYEKNSPIKTVKCSNVTCDYIASRVGFNLIPLVKPNSKEYTQWQTHFTQRQLDLLTKNG